MSAMDDADPFVAHRNLLFTVAYEMLGSAVDAEDVVQEAWLKWDRVDRAGVRDPRAYVVRIVTRTALDRLRTVSRRRETYFGPWLPEPLLTSPDVAEDVELADSLSTAMLMVLETLAPTERAVFVLREVFDVPYDDLAEAVGRTPAAVRQIAHRARAHVAERRPRGEVTRADAQAALAAFMRAIDTGDIAPLVDVLAPDVVAFGDGGGIKQAMPRPVAGIDKVSKLFATGISLMAGQMTAEPAVINGWPGLLLRVGGEIDSVMTVRIEDGLVTAIYTVRNPEKLSRISELVGVAR
jgi:RNA polymerase sigma-70 factor (ECF subfamily)